MKRPLYPADIRIGSNRAARRGLKARMPLLGTTRSVRSVLPLEFWDVLLLEQGETYMRCLPAETLKSIPGTDLLAWCLRRARYGLPTIELVELLSSLINGRKAIEICAGCGDLGRRLGIVMTDSDSQQEHTGGIRLNLGAPPTILPPEVERLEALDAVKKHRPEVVLAVYASQKYKSGDDKKGIGSYLHGVDEEALIQQVGCYIWIGNDNIFQGKRILTTSHMEIRFSGLVTRGDSKKNVIRVWGEMPPIDLVGRGSMRRVRAR